MGNISRIIFMFVNISSRLIFFSKRAEIPIYSFEKHAREERTTSIYSPHVLILEGIFALYDPRVLNMLDMKAFMIPLLESMWLTKDRSFARPMRILAYHEEVSMCPRKSEQSS